MLTGSGEPFALGAATYKDSYPGIPETEPRIYVRFRPEVTPLSFLALLGTGAHFCILNKDVLARVENRLTDHLGETVLRTAYGRIEGDLYILRIEMIAEIGDNLDIDAIAFVTPDWQGTNFIGYSGVLDRMRFAADPHINRVYYGRFT